LGKDVKIHDGERISR